MTSIFADFRLHGLLWDMAIANVGQSARQWKKIELQLNTIASSKVKPMQMSKSETYK